MVAGLAALLSLIALAYCLPRNLLLLYGDAVAHLNIARRITDSLNPGFRQLGSVWLPLPHLLLLPLVQNTSWWQTGLAGAPPSMLAYILGSAGLYRLARFWLAPAPAALAVAFFALNPGLVYMQVTAMTEPLFLCEMIWIAVLLVSLQRALGCAAKSESANDQTIHEGGVAAEPVSSADSSQRPGHPERSEGSVVLTAGATHAARLSQDLVLPDGPPTRRAPTAWGPAYPEPRERRHFFFLGLLLFAAVFTRYDGWVYAALAWSFAAISIFRAPGGLRRSSGGAFLACTALTVSAPLFWFVYNARQFHDPLDFLRGPYSAAAIERRTTPPGAGHYPGWHNWHMAGHYFLKAAELGAARPLAGNILLAFALAGVYVALRHKQARSVFSLLWLPLAFYSYSVAYGSVPIFIPPWEPHSFYNTRYGMELLSAFALGCGFALSGAQAWLRKRAPHWHTPITAAAFTLLLVNDALLLREQPLVYQEAVVNSRTRVPFEQALARGLEALPPYGRILMYTSDHVGAVQQAGIPLRRTINDGDWLLWQHALEHPAAAAPFLVALDGDPLAKAIAAHPEGLTTLDVVCSTGQPCAHIYVATAVLGSGGALQESSPGTQPENKP